jgi:isochorismate synthase EntC
VGGGFTPDSVAEQEWQETENKSKTLLQLLWNAVNLPHAKQR